MYNPYGIGPGAGNVGSYMIAGSPFLTSSGVTGSNPNLGEVRVTFPMVCRSFTVTNIGSAVLRVHFDSVANSDVYTGGHFAPLTNTNDSWTFNVKTTNVYVTVADATKTGAFVLAAELTNIHAAELTTLSGSGINGI